MKIILAGCILMVGLSVAAAARAGEPGQGAGAGTLTPESLHETLVGLGYEPTMNAAKRSTVQIDRNNLMLYHSVGAESGGGLHLRVTVAVVPENLEFAAPALHELLEAQNRIGPAYFQFDPKIRHVQLVLRRSNADWTPAKIRSEIEAFDELARSTQSVWGDDAFVRLHPGSDAPGAEEFRRLEGSFELGEGTILEGVALTAEKRAMLKMRIVGRELQFVGVKEVIRLVIDPAGAPGAIDFFLAGGTPQFGRYRLDGGVLTLHFATAGAGRPAVGAEPSGKDSILICRRAE